MSDLNQHAFFPCKLFHSFTLTGWCKISGSQGGGGGRDLVNRVKQRQTLEEQPTLGEPDKKFSGYL